MKGQTVGKVLPFQAANVLEMQDVVAVLRRHEVQPRVRSITRPAIIISPSQMEHRQTVGWELRAGRQNFNPIDRGVYGMYIRRSSQKRPTQAIGGAQSHVFVGLVGNVDELIEFVPDHQVVPFVETR